MARIPDFKNEAAAQLWESSHDFTYMEGLSRAIALPVRRGLRAAFLAGPAALAACRRPVYRKQRPGPPYFHVLAPPAQDLGGLPVNQVRPLSSGGACGV